MSGRSLMGRREGIRPGAHALAREYPVSARQPRAFWAAPVTARD